VSLVSTAEVIGLFVDEYLVIWVKGWPQNAQNWQDNFAVVF